MTEDEEREVWRQLSKFERDVNNVLWSLGEGRNDQWTSPNDRYTRFVLEEAWNRFNTIKQEDVDYGICDECGQPYDEGGKTCDCEPDEVSRRYGELKP